MHWLESCLAKIWDSCWQLLAMRCFQYPVAGYSMSLQLQAGRDTNSRTPELYF